MGARGCGMLSVTEPGPGSGRPAERLAERPWTQPGFRFLICKPRGQRGGLLLPGPPPGTLGLCLHHPRVPSGTFPGSPCAPGQATVMAATVAQEALGMRAGGASTRLCPPRRLSACGRHTGPGPWWGALACVWVPFRGRHFGGESAEGPRKQPCCRTRGALSRGVRT